MGQSHEGYFSFYKSFFKGAGKAEIINNNKYRLQKVLSSVLIFKDTIIFAFSSIGALFQR